MYVRERQVEGKRGGGGGREFELGNGRSREGGITRVVELLTIPFFPGGRSPANDGISACCQALRRREERRSNAAAQVAGERGWGHVALGGRVFACLIDGGGGNGGDDWHHAGQIKQLRFFKSFFFSAGSGVGSLRTHLTLLQRSEICDGADYPA